jgi:hypothetical protein
MDTAISFSYEAEKAFLLPIQLYLAEDLGQWFKE